MSLPTKAIEKFVYIVRDLPNRQIFDREVFNILSIKPPQNLTIFDVGCHYGESIKRFLTLFNGCRIHSFEPDIIPYNLVKDRYKDQTNISIYNFGIGAHDGTNSFHKCLVPGNSSFNKILESSKWAKQRASIYGVRPSELMKTIENVPIRSLDSFAIENDIKYVDFIKLDVEGWEDQCIKGCHNLLTNRKVGIIQLELITTQIRQHGISIDDIKKMLPKNNFDYFSRRHKQIPFTSSPEVFELLLVNKNFPNYNKKAISKRHWI